MKGSFGRLLAGVALMLGFSDAAKRDRDARSAKRREEAQTTTRPTHSRAERFLCPDGLVHYVTPSGMVRSLGPPLTTHEVATRAAMAKLEPLRLLPRAERRRLVGIEADGERPSRMPPMTTVRSARYPA
jgi:hypothetical protein